MGIAPPSKKCLQQVTGIMGKPLNLRIAASQPTGKEIHGQRETVHLGEEGDDEGGESAKCSLVTTRAGLKKTECEKQEYHGVHDYNGPKTIG